jgi:phage tail tape-measure protein
MRHHGCEVLSLQRRTLLLDHHLRPLVCRARCKAYLRLKQRSTRSPPWTPTLIEPLQHSSFMAGSAAGVAALMHPLQALKQKLFRGQAQSQNGGRLHSYSRLSDAVRQPQRPPVASDMAHLFA